MDNQSDAAAIIEATQASARVEVVRDSQTNRIRGLVRPAGKTFEPREEWNDQPDRRSTVLALASMASFLAYVTRYFDEERTLVYADPNACTFQAVLDDHPRGTADKGAAWRQHRAGYALKRSDELTAWLELCKPTAQELFAEFLNIHAGEVMRPAAADLIELALAFEAVQGGRYQSKVNPRNGTTVFHYEVETKVVSVDVPETIDIAVPLFKETPPVTLTAQIRFRIVERSLRFFLVFPTLNQQLKTYWDTMVGELAAKLPKGATILLGTPS